MDLATFLNSIPKDFSAFLAFIGTSVFAAFVVSEFVEKIPQFVAASSTVKSIVVLVLYVLLGLLSFGLVHWVPPTISEQAQPIYSIIIGTITAFLGGQYWHTTQHSVDPVPTPPTNTAAG